MQDVRRRPHQVPLGDDEPCQEYVKCVVIGDTAVGKTRLLCSHVYEEHGIPVEQFNTKSHLPTVFAIDQYMFDPVIRERSKYIIDGVHVCLRIWDTFGDHEKNRKFAYQNADVIVLCFSIGMLGSQRNINGKWFPEIRKYCPRTPLILVGTQLDRRHTDPLVFKTLGHARLRSYLAGKYQCGVYVVPDEDLVPPYIGRLTSREIGASGYYETSVVTRHGVAEVFENAIRAALVGRRNSRQLFSSHLLKRVESPKIQQPFLPPKPEAPSVHVPGSEYRDENKVLLGENEVADIVFLVGGETVYCHSILLMTTCPVFACLLAHPNVLSSLGINQPGLNTKTNGIQYHEGYINGVLTQLPRGISSVDTLCGNSFLHCKIVIKVTEVNIVCFKKMLEFLYTGQLTPPFDETELFNLATVLQINSLAAYCLNILNGETYQNIDVGKETRRHMVAEMYKLFYNRSFYSDVTFTVDDTQVPAHKAVLVAHCKMMAAMFRSGHFRESGTSIVEFPHTNLESFLAVLEYLYTGNCSALHLGDSLGTLTLANFLCLPRLVSLCEQHIIKQVDVDMEDGSRDFLLNIFVFLNTAQLHNAAQLTAWCLHYIACNYNDVCRSHGEEMKKLNTVTLKYLEKHRWPPVWYLKENDYYRKATKEAEKEKAKKASERHKRKCNSCFGV